MRQHNNCHKSKNVFANFPQFSPFSLIFHNYQTINHTNKSNKQSNQPTTGHRFSFSNNRRSVLWYTQKPPTWLDLLNKMLPIDGRWLTVSTLPVVLLPAVELLQRAHLSWLNKLGSVLACTHFAWPFVDLSNKTKPTAHRWPTQPPPPVPEAVQLLELPIDVWQGMRRSVLWCNRSAALHLRRFHKTVPIFHLHP